MFTYLVIPYFNNRLVIKLKLLNAVIMEIILLSIALSFALYDMIECNNINYSIYHSLFHIFFGFNLQYTYNTLFTIRYYILTGDDAQYKIKPLFGIDNSWFYFYIKLVDDPLVNLKKSLDDDWTFTPKTTNFGIETN